MKVQLQQVQYWTQEMEPGGLCEILGETATELEASFDLVIEEMMASRSKERG